MHCVLLCSLRVLEVAEVMHGVLLCSLEVMRGVLLCSLEVVERELSFRFSKFPLCGNFSPQSTIVANCEMSVSASMVFCPFDLRHQLLWKPRRMMVGTYVDDMTYRSWSVSKLPRSAEHHLC